ncbi:MAG: hypothetical protein K5798_10865 [Nitrosopumilus sp.]|uniref:hypothetical protein n=1 Tax=Nitrosopumilus sp. TaxID=2024843 RepID=UPI00242C00E9|nr:hypothetical protein [Nitrosopumilus sp.]MCV0367747.1 hypothetical protein [Nitrosopumilus sp.]
MKYFLIFLFLIGFIAITSIDVVYGMWFPQSPENLFEQSETVFVGTVTSVHVLEFERSNTYNVEENGISRIEIENYTQTLDEYTVNIEEFLKNPQESKTITMLEATVSGVPGRSVSIGGFELGDRVLFYVPKIDGTNQYSPESFKIPKQCDSKIVLNQSRIEGRNSFEMLQNGVIKRDNFTEGIPIDFVYKRDLGSLDGKSFDFQITIRTETDPGKFDELVLSEKINAKSNTCEWIATAKAEFVPQMGNYRTWVHTTEGTSGSSFGGSFSVNDHVEYGEIIPPLKQFQSGIVFDEIECRDDLILVQKYDRTPACVAPETKEKLSDRDWAKTSDASIWKKHITVSATRYDSADLAEFLPVYKIKGMSDDKVVNQLLVGADGCKNGTEICKIPSGVSLDRQYSFLPSDILLSDNDQFSVSLDAQQAEYLLSVMDWKNVGDSFFNTVQWNEKQYFLVLSTFDSTKTPVVKMNLVGTSHEPVSLERGMTLEYPIRVDAWATYGAPAQIDLFAVHNAKDSGIKVWVEPETMMISERSNATSTLFIRASDNAKDGIYDIRVIGQANGNNASLYCSNTVCPTVNIGNSVWEIRTFGSNGGMGIGGISTPENTWMELELNKSEFSDGDVAEIKAYLVNNSTETVQFTRGELLITVIKTQPVGYYDQLYGIHARYESDKIIVLEPKSTALLVRPFYWNQTTFQSFDDEHRLEPKQYRMISRFVGEGNTWYDDAWFEVK